VSKSESGISFGCGSLSATLIFITLLLLKVFGVVNWSWWIITCPLWISLAISLLLFVIVIGIAAIVAVLK